MFQPGDRGIISRTCGFVRDTNVTITRVDGDPIIFKTDYPDHAMLDKGFRWVEVMDDRGLRGGVPEHFITRREPPEPEIPPARVRSEDDIDAIRARMLLEQQVKPVLLAMELDWQGHHERGTAWTMNWVTPELGRRKELLTRNCGSRYGNKINPSSDDIRAVIAAAEAGEAMDRWIPIVTGERGYVCSNCDDGKHFETNGLVVRPMKPCPNPEGLVTEWTMNFASGKVIVDDDLRYLCCIASTRDINTRIGTHQQILDYANEGLTVGFGIGNSSPSVYRMVDGSYAIGKRMKPCWYVGPDPRPDLPEGDEEPTEWWVHERPDDGDEWPDDYVDDLPEGCEKVCSVCTDLWAYSIIDLDEAKRRAAYYGIDLDKTTANWSVNIIDIEPGTYTFRHFHGVDHDANNVTYATFARTGDATEPEDWCAKDASFTVDITQAIQHQIGAWPNRYEAGHDWTQQCAAVARSQFRGCVPDRDWHRNGHRNDYIRSEVENLPIRELPRFRFKGYWDISRSVIETTVTRKDDLFGGDIPFNDSYALAAGHILESTISFGLRTRRDYSETIHQNGEQVPNPNYDTYNVTATRGYMSKAATLWVGLIERYPHVAEALPEFTAWMEDVESVARWIANFDLGPEKYDRAEEGRSTGNTSLLEMLDTINAIPNG